MNDLVFDKEGHLWMATDGGVAVFDCGERWETFRAGDKLPRCMFQNVAIDRFDNIWFGTDEKGLYCLSGFKMMEPEVAENSFDPDTFIRTDLHVPAKALEAYKKHPIWGKFKNLLGDR